MTAASMAADAAFTNPRVSPSGSLRPCAAASSSSELALWCGARWSRSRVWPVAAALPGWRSGAPVRAVLLALAFGWAENMVQAAVKAVPLGQSAGQRLLGRLAAAIPAAVDEALATSDEQRQAFTPMLAILSARHEAQYSRLFRS